MYAGVPHRLRRLWRVPPGPGVGTGGRSCWLLPPLLPVQARIPMLWRPICLAKLRQSESWAETSGCTSGRATSHGLWREKNAVARPKKATSRATTLDLSNAPKVDNFHSAEVSSLLRGPKYGVRSKCRPCQRPPGVPETVAGAGAHHLAGARHAAKGAPSAADSRTSSPCAHSCASGGTPGQRGSVGAGARVSGTSVSTRVSKRRSQVVLWCPLVNTLAPASRRAGPRIPKRSRARSTRGCPSGPRRAGSRARCGCASPCCRQSTPSNRRCSRA